jgi:hypothetical protein
VKRAKGVKRLKRCDANPQPEARSGTPHRLEAAGPQATI